MGGHVCVCVCTSSIACCWLIACPLGPPHAQTTRALPCILVVFQSANRMGRNESTCCDAPDDLCPLTS